MDTRFFLHAFAACVLMSSYVYGQETGLPYKASRLAETPLRIPVAIVENNNSRKLEEAFENLSRVIQVDDVVELANSDISYFSPIGNLGRYGGRWPTPEIPDQVSEIVRQGPSAIPLLLERLSDRRQVNALIDIDVLGASTGFHLRFDRFVANAAIQHEIEFLANKLWFAEKERLASEVREYELRKCDLALILLGQIVNRPYRIIHRNDEDFFVIGVGTPKGTRLADSLVEYWEDNSQQKLFDSLVLDFCTRPISEDRVGFVEKTADETVLTVDPIDVQIGALARLIKYFPLESESLIVARLDAIVDSNGEENIDTRNGVRVIDFLSECRRSESKKIHKALAELQGRLKGKDVQKFFAKPN